MRWQVDCLTVPLPNTTNPTIQHMESNNHRMFNPRFTLIDFIELCCFPSGWPWIPDRWKSMAARKAHLFTYPFFFVVELGFEIWTSIILHDHWCVYFSFPCILCSTLHSVIILRLWSLFCAKTGFFIFIGFPLFFRFVIHTDSSPLFFRFGAFEMESLLSELPLEKVIDEARAGRVDWSDSVVEPSAFHMCAGYVSPFHFRGLVLWFFMRLEAWRHNRGGFSLISSQILLWVIPPLLPLRVMWNAVALFSLFEQTLVITPTSTTLRWSSGAPRSFMEGMWFGWQFLQYGYWCGDLWLNEPLPSRRTLWLSFIMIHETSQSPG